MGNVSAINEIQTSDQSEHYEQKEEEKEIAIIDEAQDEKKYDVELDVAYKKKRQRQNEKPMLSKQNTIFELLDQSGGDLPSLYNKDRCTSIISYYFNTFLVTHPRLYALYLLYSSTWPRGLVILDMYTDIAVAYPLYTNTESLWFMLSSMFIVLPFILVWTVSLRFIQKYI